MAVFSFWIPRALIKRKVPDLELLFPRATASPPQQDDLNCIWNGRDALCSKVPGSLAPFLYLLPSRWRLCAESHHLTAQCRTQLLTGEVPQHSGRVHALQIAAFQHFFSWNIHVCKQRSKGIKKLHRTFTFRISGHNLWTTGPSEVTQF